ncbi:MAG: hypothetical protein HRT89_20100, partial [Lentisphaeria bacterium]|nr:hypothetical protein [Lentisphaeria bacterium]
MKLSIVIMTRTIFFMILVGSFFQLSAQEQTILDNYQAGSSPGLQADTDFFGLFNNKTFAQITLNQRLQLTRMNQLYDSTFSAADFANINNGAYRVDIRSRANPFAPVVIGSPLTLNAGPHPVFDGNNVNLQFNFNNAVILDPGDYYIALYDDSAAVTAFLNNAAGPPGADVLLDQNGGLTEVAFAAFMYQLFGEEQEEGIANIATVEKAAAEEKTATEEKAAVE